MRSGYFRAGFFLFAWLLASMASAQSYPNRPIMVVFGYPPGTLQDSAARPVTCEVNRADIAIDLVAAGVGVSIVSRAQKALKHEGVVFKACRPVARQIVSQAGEA